MATTQITDEAMIAASMSLFISDQGMLNAGISSVVFSNAVGATEGTLNLINADTVTDEKLRAELKEEEEKNQDAFEAAADMAIAMAEENLERLSQPIHIGGYDFTAEEWKEIAETLSNEEDRNAVIAFATDKGHSEAQVLHAMLVIEAMERVADAEVNGLQPDPADINLINDATNDPTMRAVIDDTLAGVKHVHVLREEYTVTELNDISVAQTSNATERWAAREGMSDASHIASKANSVDMNIDVGGADPFADMLALSGEFSPVANGETQTASLDADNTATVPTPEIGLG